MTELKGRPETGKLAAGIMTQANNPVSGFPLLFPTANR
jgi:hypothetical protein